MDSATTMPELVSASILACVEEHPAAKVFANDLKRDYLEDFSRYAKRASLAAFPQQADLQTFHRALPMARNRDRHLEHIQDDEAVHAILM